MSRTVGPVQISSVPSHKIRGARVYFAREKEGKLRTIAIGHYPDIEINYHGEFPKVSEEEKADYREKVRKILYGGERVRSLIRFNGLTQHVYFRVNKDGKSSLEVYPGRYVRRVVSLKGFNNLTNEEIKQGLKNNRFSLENKVPHVLAVTGILLIGNKYIVIPKRSNSVGEARGMYYPYAGGLSAVKTGGKYVLERPHEGVLKEIHEESGIHRKELSFVGTTSTYPLPFLLSHEVDSANYDLVYLLRAKTNNPDEFVERHFAKREDGNYDPRNAQDAGDHEYVKIIPQTTEAIEDFMKNEGHFILPGFATMLHAYLRSRK